MDNRALQAALVCSVGLVEIDAEVLHIPLHGFVLHADLNYLGVFEPS